MWFIIYKITMNFSCFSGEKSRHVNGYWISKRLAIAHVGGLKRINAGEPRAVQKACAWGARILSLWNVGLDGRRSGSEKFYGTVSKSSFFDLSEPDWIVIALERDRDKFFCSVENLSPNKL